jgi:hypothetical protein
MFLGEGKQMQRGITRFVLMVAVLVGAQGSCAAKTGKGSAELTKQEYTWLMESVPADAKHGFFGKIADQSEAFCFFIIYENCDNGYCAWIGRMRDNKLEFQQVGIRDMLYERYPGYCTVAYFGLDIGPLPIDLNFASGKFSSEKSTWSFAESVLSWPVKAYQFTSMYDQSGYITLDVHRV